MYSTLRYSNTEEGKSQPIIAIARPDIALAMVLQGDTIL
jgi:hypothetical protein